MTLILVNNIIETRVTQFTIELTEALEQRPLIIIIFVTRAQLRFVNKRSEHLNNQAPHLDVENTQCDNPMENPSQGVYNRNHQVRTISHSTYHQLCDDTPDAI